MNEEIKRAVLSDEELKNVSGGCDSVTVTIPCKDIKNKYGCQSNKNCIWKDNACQSTFNDDLGTDKLIR